MTKRHQNMLSQIRRSTGMTQSFVSDKLGVSKATYSSWETGRAELGADRLVALSDLFGCTPNDILGYQSDGTRFEIISSYEEEVITLYRALPPNIKSDMYDIMRSNVKGRWTK
jgi:transcriptional regulator with XRE-family HTH domain